MIVQHIIDWAYIRSLIRNAEGGVEFELLRLKLFNMRKDIEECGVLIVDEGNGALLELQAAISDLVQFGEIQILAARDDLLRELQNYQTIYANSSLRVGSGGARSVQKVICLVNEFLHSVCLEQYELPGVLLTCDRDAGSIPGYVLTSIDRYDKVFKDVRWNVSEGFDNNESGARRFDRYMAGVSLAASCFRGDNKNSEINLLDPYLAHAFNMPVGADRERKDEHKINCYRESVKRLLCTWILNPAVSSIAFFIETKNALARDCQIKWLYDWMKERMGKFCRCGKSNPIRVSLHCCRMSIDNHNRYIFVRDVLQGCQFPAGLDICKEDGEFSRSIFSVVRLGCDARDGDRRIIHHVVENLPRYDYEQALKDSRSGYFSCDIEDWTTVCHPQGVSNRALLEFNVYPTIVMQVS